MVAITVILAAVIATLVMDFGENVDGPGVNAGVSVSGDGTDTVTVSVSDLGNSDGVAIVDSSGSVIETLTSTGASTSYSTSGSYSSGDSFTVQAYKGSVSSGSGIDTQAQENSVVGEFTLQ